jgi:hypothetical protein
MTSSQSNLGILLYAKIIKLTCKRNTIPDRQQGFNLRNYSMNFYKI